MSNQVIGYLAEKSKKQFAIIGVGGIHDADSALRHLNAGADLVQVYTGMIYSGPGMVRSMLKAMRN